MWRRRLTQVKLLLNYREKVRKAHVAYLAVMIYNISTKIQKTPTVELDFTAIRKCLGCKRLRHFLFIFKEVITQISFFFAQGYTYFSLRCALSIER